nr:hypothetical protein [Tanacetum cinerariifolium]
HVRRVGLGGKEGFKNLVKIMMERIKVLEGKKRALSAELSRSEIDRQKLVREFISAVVRRLHTSVEYRKALAVSYPYVHKVVNSYLLPMADLLRVSPDVPARRPTAEVPGSTGEQADNTDLRLPPPHHEITEDNPFGTTT